MPPNRLDVRVFVGSRPQWDSTPYGMSSIQDVLENASLAAAVKYDSGPEVE